MKLSAEVIEWSPTFINPCKERELDLRYNKIPTIENLGAAQDLFDTIDLSNNEIRKLDNFPLMRRLRTILACNNRISLISPSLDQVLPVIETLVLTNNQIGEFSDIEPIFSLKSLRHLVLLDNPVTKLANYRTFVIYKMSFLRTLDFRKVKLPEKREAKKLFGGSSGKKIQNLSTSNIENSASESVISSRNAAVVGNKILSEEETIELKKRIEQASSLHEIQYLERLLQSGHSKPADLNDDPME